MCFPTHQGQRALGVGVLREHHHPDPGMGAAERVRRPDALVGVGGRHPDVGEDDVGPHLVDQRDQRVVVVGLVHLVDVGVLAQQGRQPPPQQGAVLGEHDPDPPGGIVLSPVPPRR